ncbi:MAG: hypothetical protein JRJ77_04925 [Deltaproteobacteria bacterium]|nr:hypothetical protein [Deltaproteobacteria bacterium]MBW2340056.1 hypothetical protein [Deltaproteobacteria bacterium]
MGDVFQFLSSASLEKLTGQRAYSLEELLYLIKSCPDSSIFYHTFSAFLKMREVQVPYNSDFAIWVSRSLNEKALAEKLMAVDLSEYNVIGSLRMRLVEIIESYREHKPGAFEKRADEPFYLYDVVRVVYLTDKFAYDLKSFRDLLSTISVYSLYFHFIESRINTQLQADDFSTWIQEGLSISSLAQMIRKIDVSVYTLEGLRARILQLIDDHLKEKKDKETA